MRAIIAALLLVGSFFLEAFGQVMPGYALRAIVCLAYLFIEVNWQTKQAGSLTTGLFWALGLGWLGIVPVVHYYRAVGWRAMNWVWLGAGLYSVGAICELTKWPVIVPGYVQAHEVMHFFHSTACLCFFIFGMRYVLHFRPKSADRELAVTPELAAIAAEDDRVR